MRAAPVNFVRAQNSHELGVQASERRMEALGCPTEQGPAHVLHEAADNVVKLQPATCRSSLHAEMFR